MLAAGLQLAVAIPIDGTIDLTGKHSACQMRGGVLAIETVRETYAASGQNSSKATSDSQIARGSRPGGADSRPGRGVSAKSGETEEGIAAGEVCPQGL